MTRQGKAGLLLLLATGWLGLSCDRLDVHKSGAFGAVHAFGLGNRSVVRIEPGGRTVSLDWRGFNAGRTGLLGTEWERLEVRSGPERHVITDEGCEPGELLVDAKRFRFDHRRQILVLAFGKGVAVAQADPPRFASLVPTAESPYLRALKLADNLQGLP
jgi:hypothetical protein